MTQWYVKELSKLTNVSVRTLHHYDRIGLLKPSVRLANGYRLYSEGDLLKLQQVLALKMFGFELSHIKKLMEEKIDVIDHLRAQQRFLEQKITSLQEANQTLQAVVSECHQKKSLSWKSILKLIKEYQMTQEIEYKWVKEVLSPNELKEYVQFEQGLKKRFTPAEEEASGQEWDDLVREIQSNLAKDPTSEYGISLGKRCMDWVNKLFENHSALRATLWDKGFKGGHTDVPADVVAWLDQAISAYHKKRIYAVLDKLGTNPSEQLVKQWTDLITEICGDDQANIAEVYQAVYDDSNISAAGKAWLRKQHS